MSLSVGPSIGALTLERVKILQTNFIIDIGGINDGQK
jgi:hypothetical protein